MSAGFETIEVVDPWLFETLSTDDVIRNACGNRVGGELSDMDERDARPYVTWNMSSSIDVGLVQRGGARLWNEALYNVKVVGRGTSYAPIIPVARRIEALLNGAAVSTETGDLTCVRRQTIQYGEAAGSAKFRHLGAIYMFRANSH